MRRARWGILAGAIAALAAAAPAHAEDKATRDAQARFVEGLARVKAGDFEAARLSFEQAYVVLHKPDILWNLALSEEKSGHVVEALGHFKELGRVTPPGDDRAKTKMHIDELMAQTGHIDVEAPLGAKVYVDGTAAGVTPLADAVDVAPGKHHVAAGEAAADTDVAAGQVAHVNFVVMNPASGPSRVTPTTAAMGATVLAPLQEPAPERPREPERTDGGTTKVVTVIGLGALAVTGAALGITFGLEAQNQSSIVKGLQGNASACYMSAAGQCGQLKDAVDAQNRDTTLSIAFYLGAGALAAGAVTAWLLWPTAAPSARASLVPAMAPAGWGPGLAGNF